MVSANLRYRLEATEEQPLAFADVSYSGDQKVTKVLRNLDNLLTYEKNEALQIRIAKLEECKKGNYTKWVEKQQEIRQFKKKNPFWMFSKKNKEVLWSMGVDLDNLEFVDIDLEMRIADLNKECFYTSEELMNRYKRMLGELGFECKSRTVSKADLHSHIYESTCSDEELLTRSMALIQKIQNRKAKAREEAENTPVDIATADAESMEQ